MAANGHLWTFIPLFFVIVGETISNFVEMLLVCEPAA